MYELYDPCTVMFFFRNKHIMIDLGTGNNNKINWPMEDKQVQKYIHNDDKQNYPLCKSRLLVEKCECY